MKFILSLLLVFTISLSQAKTILFLGDSLTEGLGVDKENAYPDVVGKKLKLKGHDVKIINGGISGSTTASGLKRLDWFFKAKPEIMFLALGANDGLRGQKIPNIEKNLEDIIKAAQEKKMKIILAQMNLPPNYGKEYTESFKNIYVKLAKKYNLVLLEFMLEGVGGIKKHNIEDGIHPNEIGHEILSDKVVKLLEPLL